MPDRDAGYEHFIISAGQPVTCSSTRRASRDDVRHLSSPLGRSSRRRRDAAVDGLLAGATCPPVPSRYQATLKPLVTSCLCDNPIQCTWTCCRGRAPNLHELPVPGPSTRAAAGRCDYGMWTARMVAARMVACRPATARLTTWDAADVLRPGPTPMMRGNADRGRVLAHDRRRDGCCAMIYLSRGCSGSGTGQ